MEAFKNQAALLRDAAAKALQEAKAKVAAIPDQAVRSKLEAILAGIEAGKIDAKAFQETAKQLINGD